MNIGPNWKNAPPWAEFAAMDCHGAWHWYENEPALAEKLGMWTARGTHFSVAAITLTDWQNTLHARGEQWPKPVESVRVSYEPQLKRIDEPVAVGDLLALTELAEQTFPSGS